MTLPRRTNGPAPNADPQRAQGRIAQQRDGYDPHRPSIAHTAPLVDEVFARGMVDTWSSTSLN